MAQISSLIVKIQAQTAEARSQIAATRKAFAEMAKKADEGQAPVNRLNRELESTGSIAKTAKAALLGLFSLQTARQVAALTDEYQNLTNQLRVVVAEGTDVNEVFSRLKGLANDTRTGVAGTVDIYSKLTRASKDLGLSQTQVLALSKTVGQGLALSGSNAQEAYSAIRNLSQGLAEGALRGQDFNAVMDNGIGIIQSLAAGLGVPASQMRKLAFEGKLTTDKIIEGLLKASEVTDERFNKSTVTLGQSVTQLKNNWLEFVGQLTTTSGVADGLAKSISLLANNLSTIGSVAIPVAQGLALVYGGKLAGAIATATAARVGEIKAQLAEMASSNRLAAVKARHAAQTHALALAQHQQAKAALASAMANRTAAGGATALTAASTAAHAATINLARAQAGLAAIQGAGVVGSMGALGTATRITAGAFGRLLGFLGGPVGAVVSLGLLATSLFDVTKLFGGFNSEVDEAAGKVAKLGGSADLTQLKNQIREAKLDLVNSGKALSQAVKEQALLDEGTKKYAEQQKRISQLARQNNDYRINLKKLTAEYRAMGGAAAELNEENEGTKRTAYGVAGAYTELKAKFDEATKLKADYLAATQDVMAANLGEARTNELLGLALKEYTDGLEGLRQKQAELAGETYKDQLTEFLDAKKSEIEALLDRIDGGSGNFGNVNTQGIFGDTDKAVKSSRNFEVSAKILADAIRRGDASEEVLARGLQGLQNTIGIYSNSLAQNYDIEGMQAVVDKLAQMARESFSEAERPLTYADYLKAFELEKANALENTQSLIDGLDSISARDTARLGDFISQAVAKNEAQPMGEVNFNLQTDSGKLSGKLMGEPKFLRELRTFVNRTVNEAARAVVD